MWSLPPNDHLRGSDSGDRRDITSSAGYSKQMELFVADHPLISHKVTLLRDKNTPTAQFRQLVEELVELMIFDATKDLKTEAIQVETPLTIAEGSRLAQPKLLVVPILRAGLGMLSGISRIIPEVEIGFIGVRRDEVTLRPETYAEKLPADLSGRRVYLLDPMLATGGTLSLAIDLVMKRGAAQVDALCILGSPNGVVALRKWHSKVGRNFPVRLFLAQLDDSLNANGYIVPGLGDAGDRMFGLAN